MAYTTGSSVTVAGYGTGIVEAVVGGPQDRTYHVVLDARDIETGLPTRIEVPASVLTDGPVRPTYTVGERVVYLGRTGTIIAIVDDMLDLVMDPDPPKPNGLPRQLHFVMPAWHLTLHQL